MPLTEPSARGATIQLQTPRQGNIASWKKGEGDEIAAGDVLAEVETDKATMDWEAQARTHRHHSSSSIVHHCVCNVLSSS